MFGISGEHLLVLLVVLLFFGPRRLPELGNSLGRTLKNFKDAMAGNDASTTSSPAPQAQSLPKTEAPAANAAPSDAKTAEPASVAKS